MFRNGQELRETWECRAWNDRVHALPIVIGWAWQLSFTILSTSSMICRFLETMNPKPRQDQLLEAHEHQLAA